MYLSHPVRRMREDPADAAVGLVVTAVDQETADALEPALADLGEETERLRFGAIELTVPQDRIDDICTLEGIKSIETAATREIPDEATDEDVEFEG